MIKCAPLEEHFACLPQSIDRGRADAYFRRYCRGTFLSKPINSCRSERRISYLGTARNQHSLRSVLVTNDESSRQSLNKLSTSIGGLPDSIVRARFALPVATTILWVPPCAQRATYSPNPEASREVAKMLQTQPVQHIIASSMQELSCVWYISENDNEHSEGSPPIEMSQRHATDLLGDISEPSKVETWRN
jgi:hypothetical protein